jgi:hypothetical protein
MSIFNVNIIHSGKHTNEKFNGLRFEGCTNRHKLKFCYFYVTAPGYTFSVQKATICIEYLVLSVEFQKSISGKVEPFKSSSLVY